MWVSVGEVGGLSMGVLLLECVGEICGLSMWVSVGEVGG